MRIAFLTMTFLISFLVDVRVRARADKPSALPFVQVPEQCLRASGTCAIKSLGDPFADFAIDGVHISARNRARLIRLDNDRWQLLAGRVWVKSLTAFTVSTVFAKFSFAQGQVLTERDGQSLVIHVLAGEDFKIELRGSNKSRVLVPGYTYRISGLDRDGHSVVEVPQPIELAGLIGDWAEVYPGDRQQMARELDKVQAHWHQAIDEAGDWQVQEVQRQVAALSDQRRKAREQRSRREEFNQSLVELLMKKTNLK